VSPLVGPGRTSGFVSTDSRSGQGVSLYMTLVAGTIGILAVPA
jgi:hypothetical protein